MLRYRILTAIVALPLVIWGVLKLHPLAFAIIMGVIVAYGGWEWTKLLKINNIWLRSIYVLLVIVCLYASLHVPVFLVLSVGLLVWLWSFFVVYAFNKHHPKNIAVGAEYVFVRAGLGLCVLVSCWIAMVVLRWPIIGAYWLLFVFIIVWVTDTGAYFAGRRWGKHKLAVNVSPNKTWEGVWGGLICGFACAVIISFCVNLTWQFRFYFWGLSIVAMVFSIVGDLTISVFKRQSKLKDSGNLFPGHGGVLDRLDSIMPAVVIYAFGILFLIK